MADVRALLAANEKLSHSVLRTRAAEVDQSRRFPRENMAALGKTGILGLLVPPHFGGAGAGLAEMSRSLCYAPTKQNLEAPKHKYLVKATFDKPVEADKNG